MIRLRGGGGGIFINVLGKRLYFPDVDKSTSIMSLKKMVEDRLGIPCDRQIMSYNGQSLLDSTSPPIISSSV